MKCLLLVLIVASSACAYSVPEGATTSWYTPMGDLSSFPDDLHTVEDPGRPTGLAVRFQQGVLDGLGGTLPEDFNILRALQDLDGFGTTAPIILRFTQAPDPDTVTADTVHLWDLDGEIERPCSFRWADGGQTLMVEPLRPLSPQSLHGLLVDRGVLDDEGGEIWASVVIHELLQGKSREPQLQRLEARYARLLEVSGASEEEVVHAVVFTTQSTGAQDRAMAQALSALTPTFVPGSCHDAQGVLECSALLTVTDFFGADQVLEAVGLDDLIPQRTVDLPVLVFLPGDGSGGPFPISLYGHGLGGDKGQARSFARQLAPLGLAVAAVDAPAHGEHPTATATDFLTTVFDFFGLTLSPPGFNVRVLRDRWRQAALDKVQLVAALRNSPDLTGDGVPDIDGTRIVYGGHSLGGVMGAELLALEPTIPLAYFSVPGARIGDIVRLGGIFAPISMAMRPPEASDGDVERFYPMLQAAIDRGDAANYAGSLLDGSRDILMTIVQDDSIMPNPSTEFLARALGVEVLEPSIWPIEGLAGVGPAPVEENIGGATGVLVQYDLYWDEGQGQWMEADHDDVHDSQLGQIVYTHFYQSWLDGGHGEVLDGYSLLPTR